MKPTIVGEIGAMYDADKITALDSRPADFDAYWASCRSKLDQLPLDPKLTEVGVPQALQGKVTCYSIEVQCLGHTPVTGYLAVPVGAKPKSLPACVNYLSMVNSWCAAAVWAVSRRSPRRRWIAMSPSRS